MKYSLVMSGFILFVLTFWALMVYPWREYDGSRIRVYGNIYSRMHGRAVAHQMIDAQFVDTLELENNKMDMSPPPPVFGGYR